MVTSYLRTTHLVAGGHHQQGARGVERKGGDGLGYTTFDRAGDSGCTGSWSQEWGRGEDERRGRGEVERSDVDGGRGSTGKMGPSMHRE